MRVLPAVGQCTGRLSTIAVLGVVAVVPVGDVDADVAALRPPAIGYVAVQVLCAAAVLLSPARRRSTGQRPTDVEVVSP